MGFFPHRLLLWWGVIASMMVMMAQGQGATFRLGDEAAAELDVLGQAAMLSVFPNPEQTPRVLRLQESPADLMSPGRDLRAVQQEPAPVLVPEGIITSPPLLPRDVPIPEPEPAAEKPVSAPEIPRIPVPPRRPEARQTGGGAMPATAGGNTEKTAPAGWRHYAQPADAARLTDVWEAFQRFKKRVPARKLYDIGPEIWESLSLEAKGQIRAEHILGEWSCRSLKVVHDAVFGFPYTRCHFQVKEGRLFLERNSGTQRSAGYLWEDGGSWVFLGGLAYGEEALPLYSGLDDSGLDDSGLAPAARPQDLTGRLFPAAGGQMLMVMPEPGSYQILEFRR